MEALGGQYLLLFIRALGVISLLPIGSGAGGITQKAPLAAGLAALGFLWVEETPGFSLSAALAEFLIGLTVGVPMALAVSSAQMWAELFDSSRGQNMALIMDPLTEHQLSPLATLFHHLSWATILLSGGLLFLVKGYLEGLHTLPLGTQAINAAWGQQLMLLTTQTMQATMFLAVPAAALFVAVEIAAAFAARLMPQLQPGGEVFVIKCVLGWMLLWYLVNSGNLMTYFPIRGVP